MDCPLCFNESSLFDSNTFSCSNCSLIFKDSILHLSSDEEFIRYGHHQNSSDDQGYLDFLNKLLMPLKTFLPSDFVGIDFGCGPGPTLSSLLEECGGEVSFYDPHFYPDAQTLIPDFYDVVTCTEVVEHFKNPSHDWEILMGLAKEGGLIAIMTQIFNKNLKDYSTWWYKNDPTHVVFYQKESIYYISEKYACDLVYFDEKSVAIFKKR